MKIKKLVKNILLMTRKDLSKNMALTDINALTDRIEKLEKQNTNLKNKVNKLEYWNKIQTRNNHSLFRVTTNKTLKSFQGKYSGGRCFIVGNGPSLNKIDMARLKDEITLGSNRVYLGFDKWGFEFTYWMTQDRILVSQNSDEFSEILSDDIIKFIPFSLIKEFDLEKLKNVVPVNLDYTRQMEISNDPEVLCEGFTVTFGLIQIAIIMGFKEIILVGIDHNYTIPKENITEDNKWKGHNISNHFCEEYSNSENDQIWEMPDIEKMTNAYNAAAEWAKKNNVSIKNASPGTKLESFELISFEKLFS